MSQWDLQANETSVYFKNTVNDEVVEADPRVKFYRKMQCVELNRETWNRTQL